MIFYPVDRESRTTEIALRYPFDPTPLLRHLELNLPDLREAPVFPASHNMFDGGRKQVSDWQIAEALGTNRRQVQRLRHGTHLTRRNADRFAIRLGLHPCLLWPDWFAA